SGHADRGIADEDRGEPKHRARAQEEKQPSPATLALESRSQGQREHGGQRPAERAHRGEELGGGERAQDRPRAPCEPKPRARERLRRPSERGDPQEPGGERPSRRMAESAERESGDEDGQEGG